MTVKSVTYFMLVMAACVVERQAPLIPRAYQMGLLISSIPTVKVAAPQVCRRGHWPLQLHNTCAIRPKPAHAVAHLPFFHIPSPYQKVSGYLYAETSGYWLRMGKPSTFGVSD